MRILFLTQRLPYAPNRGDRVRAYHLLKHLRPRAEIDLVSFVHDAEEASHEPEAAALVSSVEAIRVPRFRNMIRSGLSLPTSRPTTHTMLDAPDARRRIARLVQAHPPSVVFAYCTGAAHLAFDPLLANVPLIVDMVDVDSAKWSALARATTFPKSRIYRREARCLAEFERRAVRRAFATLITTEAERATLLALAPDARVEVVQNGVDAEALRPVGAPSSSATVVFCGVMNYEPNEQGALWLAREVWPKVRARRPDARLQLVGSSPTAALRALHGEDGTIEVTGSVPDVRPYLWNAAVAVAPLLVARGVQNKVLEAVAAGLPTVATPVVMTGVPPEVQPACLTADGAGAFASAIVDLLEKTPADRRAIATRANVSSLTWDERLRGVGDIVLAAAKRGRHR